MRIANANHESKRWNANNEWNNESMRKQMRMRITANQTTDCE
jgi:hypothetical protein